MTGIFIIVFILILIITIIITIIRLLLLIQYWKYSRAAAAVERRFPIRSAKETTLKLSLYLKWINIRMFMNIYIPFTKTCQPFLDWTPLPSYHWKNTVLTTSNHLASGGGVLFSASFISFGLCSPFWAQYRRLSCEVLFANFLAGGQVAYSEKWF